MAVVSVSLFFLYFFLSLVPLTRSYWSIDIIVSVVKNYFKSQVFDHYSVDVFVYTTLYIMRLLG